MSKTTFEPKAKTMAIGENKPENTPLKDAFKKTDNSSYKSVGSSKWKALGLSKSSPLDQLGSFATEFGNAIKESSENGSFGGYELRPINPFDLTFKVRATKNDYLKHFRAPEYPPNLPTHLFPKDDKEDLKRSISETRKFYNEHLDYNNARLDNVTKTLRNGKLSSMDTEILRKFVIDLKAVIKFTKEQLKELERYEEENIGEEGAVS